MKVLHIIVGLDVGGAETMLKRLIESAPVSLTETIVVSLTSIGVVGESLRARGVCVYALGMSSFWCAPMVLWRLIWLIRKCRPAIVQTWMYHADLIGGLAARLAGCCAVVWNIRSTNIPQGALSVTFWIVRLCAIFSYFIPDRIICCANSVKTAHIKLRYVAHKMIVIQNGFDFSAFEIDSNSRQRARLELGCNAGDIVIGVVGRFDPLKDFHNFVTAASYVSLKCANVKYLMIGRGNEWSNPTLCDWIERAGLIEKFHLVGQKNDVNYYFSALDIFCLSSVSEGFPNVVVEAMAMQLPCVVTSAGDAAEILGDNGFIVPVKDSMALADALLRICYLDPKIRKNLGVRGAEKVRTEYGIEKISRKYEEIYGLVSK